MSKTQMPIGKAVKVAGAGLLLLWWLPTLAAQSFKAPAGKPPAPVVLQAIKDKSDKLAKMIAVLRKQGVRDPGLADTEVYLEAALKIVEHNEFFQADAGDWTLEVLDRGLLRARFLATGEAPWALATGSVLRGYRSRLDGSVQPYAVTLPASYGKEPGKKWRVDVVLHGRNPTLTEVKFLKDFLGDKPAGDAPFVKIDIFGRGNNAYRWAGEVDVLETLEHFQAAERLVGRDRLLDGSRVVLRGFSMGGAGTWHLGLHAPDRWCVIGPGAGFATTHGYLPSIPNPLPYPQEEGLRIYDAADYALNAFNVPIVAYSGAKDPQKQAADTIETRLKELHLSMTHLIAPDLAHQFPPEWQKKAEAVYAKYAGSGRPEYPAEVRFVTYTLKYPSCNWVEILGLDRHYQQALVEARRVENGFTVTTGNVRVLHLTLPEGAAAAQTIAIDGQNLRAKPWVNLGGTNNLYLQKRQGQWTSVLPQRLITERAQVPQKISGLTGPIDDAFTDAFLCVRGTEAPWHEATAKYADGNLERFKREWAKFFRGTLPVKDDIDVTNEDIAGKHLVLFGDPASNSLIAQVLDGLPLKWTKEFVEFSGAKGSAADHVPVLIHPNPLNAARYVVLNSGHTFHAADFEGTNALLYPRLGDYAVLKLQPTAQDPLGVSVVTSGLFNDFWKLEKK
jgi:predicted esterase